MLVSERVKPSTSINQHRSPKVTTLNKPWVDVIWVFPKNRGTKKPKMDGENNGSKLPNPIKMDDLGG